MFRPFRLDAQSQEFFAIAKPVRSKLFNMDVHKLWHGCHDPKDCREILQLALMR